MDTLWTWDGAISGILAGVSGTRATQMVSGFQTTGVFFIPSGV